METPEFVIENGDVVPAAEASIPIFNPVIFNALGVYETLLVWDGIIFHPEEHLMRLRRSAGLLGLSCPWKLGDVVNWLHEISEVNHATRARLKILLIGPGPARTGPTCFLWTWPLPQIPDRAYDQGVSVVTYRAVRFMPQSKSTNTLANLMATRAARAADAHEALLVNHRGEITEGATSNFFVVKDGTLIHAPEDQILTGVTMSLVLRMAQDADIPIKETSIPLADRAKWQEAFITSTSRHVMPVVRVDGAPVAGGKIGPITRQLMGLFEKYFEAYIRERKQRRDDTRRNLVDNSG